MYERAVGVADIEAETQVECVRARTRNYKDGCYVA